MPDAVCGGCEEAGLWVGLSLRNSVTAGLSYPLSSIFFGKEGPAGQGQSLGHARARERPGVIS